MSCCGNKRIEWAQSVPQNNVLAASLNEMSAFSPKPDVIFEYIGKTGLTVEGQFTHQKYRFSFTGDTQSVDYRDASDCMSIHVLKKVKITNQA
jgi:hypothetical protein